MTYSATRKPAKLAVLLLSLALTVSFISCTSVQWEEPNSASSPLIVNPGSYCLPLTILADTMFPWPINLKSNDTRFTFQAGFYITYQATYANDIMGCSGDVAPGLYVINFTLDNSSWSGPGLLYIQVSNTPIELFIDPIVTISTGSATGTSFNLVSLSPWSDMTITPSLSSSEFSVSPSSLTFRPNSTSQGFTFTTNGNTKTTSSITVTYTISGTNKATYNLTQSAGVVNVPGGSNQTTSTSTSTSTTPSTSTSTSTSTTPSTSTSTSTSTTPSTSTSTTPSTSTSTSTSTTPSTSTSTSTSTNTTGGTSTTKNTTSGTTTTNNTGSTTTTTPTTTTTTTTPTTTTTTTTPTTTTTTPTTSTTSTTSTTGGKTTLTASSTNVTIIAGTFTLPLTLTTTGSSFKSNLWCTASTSGFMFNPQLVANSGVISSSAYLGASGTTAAGTYNVTFWCNDTKYTSPVPFTVKVTKGQVKIPAPDAVTVKYVNGFTASSVPVTIDLSDSPPFQDLIITPVPSDNNWVVFPSQLYFTGAAKTASFVYQLKPSASGNFTTKVTFQLSGTNGASYTMPGTQTLKGVGKAN